MMKLKEVFREVIIGILPIALVITILQFTITPVAMETYLTFLWCTVFVIIGLFLFLIGIQYGFLEAGENIGRATVKLGKMRWILFVTILLGFGVTLLEPDVQVFSNQAADLIESINGETLCMVIAIGVGLFVGIAFLRMFLNISIKYILIAITWIFSMVMIKLYAPADTENVPILRKKERTLKKNFSYITMSLTLIASMLIKDTVISNLLIFLTIFQTIWISKFIYKLTNNKYGYEEYIKLKNVT